MMKTNRYLCTILAATASFVFWGCSDETEPNLKPTPVDRPAWGVDYGSGEYDPEWERDMPAAGLFQSSMTAAVGLSDYLEGFCGDADRLAAFVGSECRGTVKPLLYEGRHLFLLHIRGNVTETEKVTLKYYSAKNRHVYECPDLFEFTTNGAYGNLAEPVSPPFDETAKYPESMTVTVSIARRPVYDLHESDMFAAFVGHECRGVAEPVDVNGQIMYDFVIRGRKNESADIRFCYYSHHKAGLYEAVETLRFAGGTNAGTPESPFRIVLTSVIQ